MISVIHFLNMASGYLTVAEAVCARYEAHREGLEPHKYHQRDVMPHVLHYLDHHPMLRCYAARKGYDYMLWCARRSWPRLGRSLVSDFWKQGRGAYYFYDARKLAHGQPLYV